MSTNTVNEIPDRIRSLIVGIYLEKPIDEYPREEIAKLTPKTINGIGKYYATKLKRKAGIKTIADLATLDYTKAKELGISQKLLKKWTLSATIIHKFALSTEIPLSARRVCFAGLEAAGKTSIIKTLQNQKTTPADLPTQGVALEHLSFLGLDISVWDLGGQASFRNLYLDDPTHYLARSMLLFFVLDSQQEDLAPQASLYLEDLLIKLRYLKETPKIFVVLHKVDPELDKEVINRSIDHIIEKINPVLLKHGIRQRAIRTSIFDVNGLVWYFSRIFADISPISEILSDSLAFYSQTHGLAASFLITESGFIAAEWTEQIKDTRDKVFLEVMEEIRKEVYETAEKRPHFSFISQIGGIFITIDRIEFGSINLFLCSISTEPKSIDDPEMEKLHEEIRPWIFNFFSIITT